MQLLLPSLPLKVPLLSNAGLCADSVKRICCTGSNSCWSKVNYELDSYSLHRSLNNELQISNFHIRNVAEQPPPARSGESDDY